MTQNNIVEAETRSVGRPPSFPGQKTAKILTNIPEETAKLLREMAAAKGKRINDVVNALVLAAHAAAEKRASRPPRVRKG